MNWWTAERDCAMHPRDHRQPVDLLLAQSCYTIIVIIYSNKQSNNFNETSGTVEGQTFETWLDFHKTVCLTVDFAKVRG